MFKWIAKISESPPQLASTWGVARSMVAGSSALTLLFNDPSSVNIQASSLAENGFCSGIRAATLTCLVENGEYGWLSHVVLLLTFIFIASGLFPRITGVLHLYAILSFQNVLTTTDGGEHVALVYAVLALPICLVDGRRTHWTKWPARNGESFGEALERSTVVTFQMALRLQISLIYFVAGISKLPVAEWAEGTAVYYWSVAPYLASPEGLSGFIQAALSIPIVLIIATYCPLILELALAVSILLPSRMQKLLRYLGIGFHLMIGLMFSIWSFVLVMCAMLLILIGPNEIRDLFILKVSSLSDVRPEKPSSNKRTNQNGLEADEVRSVPSNITDLSGRRS